MDKRRIRKHRSHKRALAVCRERRSFFDATISGALAYERAERLVLHEAAQFRAQEACRLQRYAATARCREARTRMHRGIRHVCTVAGVPAIGLTFETSRLTNDVHRVARWEAILSTAAPYAERLEAVGIQPGLLDTLARELAAFQHAKSAISSAGQQYTEATAVLDRTFRDAEIALAVLEGILATSADAPVGVRDALRRAKVIGPRVRKADRAVHPAKTQTPATSPVETDGRRRRWVPRILVSFAPLAPVAAPLFWRHTAAASAPDDTEHDALAKAG